MFLNQNLKSYAVVFDIFQIKVTKVSFFAVKQPQNGHLKGVFQNQNFREYVAYCQACF